MGPVSAEVEIDVPRQRAFDAIADLALRPAFTDRFVSDFHLTRIGRSATADIRLDDPSVSRRHALIVSEKPDSLRVLDDRSLNGVFLNGELVEWGRVEDGDELAIGRYRLFALER